MGTSSCNKINNDNLTSRYSDQLLQKPNMNRLTNENYKEYFKLVNMKLRRYYEENKNSQINISICLEKKDFNTIVTTKRLVCDPNQRFIYWKKFLLSYLNKQTQKGCLWSNDLYDLIDAELFLSENKWLSLFFWQEYEMRTKPKCLDISKLRRTMETNDFDQESHNISISDKLNGSFCSINTDTLSASDPTHEYKEFRSKVKAYMEIFKEHVFDADHPINIVSRFFKEKFSEYLAEKLKELHSIRNCRDIPDFNRICNIKTTETIKELQKFIIKLQTCLRLMYSRTINYQYFIEEKDEVINLITNLVFKDGIIYGKLYELFELALFDEIKIFEAKLNELKGTKPQDLGINRKFCLNDDTLLLQKKMAIEKIDKASKKKEEKVHNSAEKQNKTMKKIDELNFLIENKIEENNDFSNNFEININNDVDLNVNDFIEFKANNRKKIEEHLKNLDENLLDSVEIGKQILQNIDQKIKNYSTDVHDFYPSPTSDATIKLNIKESIPNQDELTDIDLYHQDNDEIEKGNLYKNTNRNKNFKKIDEKGKYDNEEFFDSHNVQVNTDDIQNQIRQNKQNLKVINETDQMTKSMKKAKHKYIYNYSSYEQAVKMIKSINRYRVPFEKMILIATLASEITECVNEFWKDFENIVTSSLLNIDADELMTIFIYVVIKSHMSELLIHAKFIKEFTTSNSRSTMIGYYFTTLEAAIIYILSVKDKESFKSKDKDGIFTTLIPDKVSFLNRDV